MCMISWRVPILVSAMLCVSRRCVYVVSFPDPPPPFRQFYLDRGADLNKIGGTAEVGLGRD